MNTRLNLSLLKKLKYKLVFHARLLDTKTTVSSFSDIQTEHDSIQRIYVINLDRKPKRWNQMCRELKRIHFLYGGGSLLKISRRFSAIDARYLSDKIDKKKLHPYFSLADQLLVEPNPLVDIDDKSRAISIKMTPQEIAIALSHIEVWQLVADSNIPYTLILEDDIYFINGFGKEFDAAWEEISLSHLNRKDFDILFVSYEETGAKNQKKNRYTQPVRRPDRGIWQASGYIISREGAQKLLKLLPVYGPVDLWLNLQFSNLNTYLTRTSIIEQRIDVPSTNSYSIMPVLSKIGAYTKEKPLVPCSKKLQQPVFAFGNPDSGLTALSMALSILGYTCCSDLNTLHEQELHNLMKKKHTYFNCYVNIGLFDTLLIHHIINLYPNARFIFTSLDESLAEIVPIERKIYIPVDHKDKWELLCSFLNCEYPASPYPMCRDIGQREVMKINKATKQFTIEKLKSDSSPYIIASKNWYGIRINDDNAKKNNKSFSNILLNGDNIKKDNQWYFRDDTFPSNLAIFTPENVKVANSEILQLVLREQSTNMRAYTSSAIASKPVYLYGNFSAEIRPSNVSGLVTGMFLHRNGPHQEIDIEFLGKDTTKMLINVFYNPGTEGTKLEYGYRGTPVLVNLGFDAADKFHLYEIEWSENDIRWFVDSQIVYERLMWGPTPIPNLPMEFNINLWCSRSTELAGKVDKEKLPALSEIKSMHIVTSQTADRRDYSTVHNVSRSEPF